MSKTSDYERSGHLFALYRGPEVRRHYPDGSLNYEQTEDELRRNTGVCYDHHGFGL